MKLARQPVARVLCWHAPLRRSWGARGRITTGGTTKEPGQKPAAPDSSLADPQGADCNNDEGHAAGLALLPALFEHIAKVRYPLGTGLGRRSIWKLGEFGERRAVRGLEWISGTALVPWRRLQVRRSRKSSKAIEDHVPSSRPQGQRDRACQACVTGWAWDNGEVEQNAAR